MVTASRLFFIQVVFVKERNVLSLLVRHQCYRSLLVMDILCCVALECRVSWTLQPMLCKKMLQHIARVHTLEIIIFQTLQTTAVSMFFHLSSWNEATLWTSVISSCFVWVWRRHFATHKCHENMPASLKLISSEAYNSSRSDDVEGVVSGWVSQFPSLLTIQSSTAVCFWKHWSNPYQLVKLRNITWLHDFTRHFK